MIKIWRKCERCNGTGVLVVFGAPQTTCMDCAGSGRMQYADVDELDVKLDAIMAEQESQRADLILALGTIIAEQAAQRADLTAALTQIWNKVKDL